MRPVLIAKALMRLTPHFLAKQEIPCLSISLDNKQAGKQKRELMTEVYRSRPHALGYTKSETLQQWFSTCGLQPLRDGWSNDLFTGVT